MSITMNELRTKTDPITEKVVAWRRYLHEHPEVSFQEENTSQYVYDQLCHIDGLMVTRPTKTSVMARLIGDRPGRVLAIRADMDALPILEENTFDFVSKNPGAMHACGHDGHTAMLLGTATVLAGMREHIAGEIRFLFQHAEELFPGGAQEMVDAGVLDGVDQVIGTHLWASLPCGQIAIAPGPVMAAPDTFTITIKGKGGHAAHPDQTVDSIAIGAQLVTNLQHVVSRNRDPLKPMVLSVTTFHAGTAFNVIPDSATLSGTVRTFDASLRAAAPGMMERVIRGVTEAHGASYEFKYTNGYHPVVNDPGLTAQLKAAFVEQFGDSIVSDAVPSMGGEDFSAYQQKVPGCFFFIGAGNVEKGIVYPHHHPRFTVDEDALPVGVQSFVTAVFALMD